MSLPQADSDHLVERRIHHEVTVEGAMTNVVFPEWPLPPGYDSASTSLLIRLQAGYPDLPPDMWWFDPPVRRADAAIIPGTEAVEQHLGRNWQRWSRHFQAGQWKSGVDGLESFLALIRSELDKAAAPLAA